MTSQEKLINVRPCRIANPSFKMSRKVRRVPVTLDSRDVTELSENEIRVILRAADDIIGSGRRGLLAKILKGSKQKAVLEHVLDQSPAYGALSDLSLEQITARIDWLIINSYLDIEYDYRCWFMHHVAGRSRERPMPMSFSTVLIEFSPTAMQCRISAG